MTRKPKPSFNQRLQFWLKFALQPPIVSRSAHLLTVHCSDYRSADLLLQNYCVLRRISVEGIQSEQPTVLDIWAKGRRYDCVQL